MMLIIVIEFILSPQSFQLAKRKKFSERVIKQEFPSKRVQNYSKVNTFKFSINQTKFYLFSTFFFPSYLKCFP